MLKPLRYLAIPIALLLTSAASSPLPDDCNGCNGTGGGTTYNSALGSGGLKIEIQMVATIASGGCHTVDNMCKQDEPCPVTLVGSYKSTTQVKVKLTRDTLGPRWTSGALAATSSWVEVGSNSDPVGCGYDIDPSATVFIPGTLVLATVTDHLECSVCQF